MNILYLCDEYPPCQHGGIGTVTQILARELVKKGHHVWVCGFYPYYRKAVSFEDDHGVSVNRRFYGTRLLLKISKHNILGRVFNIKNSFNKYTEYLWDVIKKNRIDIIEIPDFNEAFYYSGPRFLNFPKFEIPSVIKIHGTFSFFKHIKGESYLNTKLYDKEMLLLSTATKVLSISEFSKKIIKNIFHYNKDIYVINNGISLNNYIRDIENSSNTVVFAGTLDEKKGILSLVKAWGNVVSKIPSARLFVYGKGGATSLKKINDLISDKTKGSIKMMGFVDRLKLSEIYMTASCAIFPSYAESFSMAPLESMQVGCPTIYTKRASGPELISSGIDGLLVDPDNIQEIADAIIYLLNNHTAANLIGQNGAETVREKFSISSIGDAHVEFYLNLIKDRE